MKKIRPKDINRKWHLFDAKNKVAGRLATDIARILMGKNKVYYTPNLDCGDYVVVVNSKKVVMSGKKEKQKKYYHHSQYPGGLYQKTASQLREKKPEEIIRHAIRGMLPKTILGKIMLKKLFVYPDNEHPHQKEFAKN